MPARRGVVLVGCRRRRDHRAGREEGRDGVREQHLGDDAFGLLVGDAPRAVPVAGTAVALQVAERVRICRAPLVELVAPLGIEVLAVLRMGCARVAVRRDDDVMIGRRACSGCTARCRVRARAEGPDAASSVPRARERGGTGRRPGFRIQCPKGRGSSSLPARTRPSQSRRPRRSARGEVVDGEGGWAVAGGGGEEAPDADGAGCLQCGGGVGGGEVPGGWFGGAVGPDACLHVGG